MERSLGYIIGTAVVFLVLSVAGLLFGGAIVGFLAIAVAFPIAAPMTTSAIIVALVAGYFAYRRKRRNRQDDP